MKIALVSGAILYKSWLTPLNPDQKENLFNQIDKWLEQGVIEPRVSPWVLPLVPVKTKDRRTRRVTDLRELNKQMVKDSYLLTNIREILHSLQGATVFSSLNAWGELNPVVEHVPHLLAHLACSSIYMYAFWVSQRWKRVQQDAGCSHERGGLGFLEVIPGWYTDFQWRTLGTFRTFGPGSTSTRHRHGVKMQPCKPSCSSLRWST